MKIHRILAIMLAAVLLLPSCADETEPYPTPTLIRLEAEVPPPTELYCGALDLTVRLPDGWQWYSQSTNLTENAADSADFAALERVEYDDGYTIELCELWSTSDSALSSHASLLLYADVVEELTYDEYTAALKSTLNGRRDGYIWALSGAETVNDGVRDWTVFVAAVQPPEGDTRYIEEYRVCEPSQGVFLVACLTWWEGSDASLAAATLARTVYTVG